MLTISIQEALSREDRGDIQHLYLYREGDIVFYIGRSIHPFERLQEHLGRTKRRPYPDAIGSFLLDNQPASLTWHLQLYTIQEIVPDLYNMIDPLHTGAYRDLAAQIEESAILNYRPCLNDTLNYERTPLPPQYDKNPIANAGVKLSSDNEEEE